MAPEIRIAISIGISALLILIGWIAGRSAERKHFRSIARREHRFRHMITTTLAEPPDGPPIGEAMLVQGSVVISLDYFKRFIAGLKMIVGGRLEAYAPLLERARREALLRMQEDAHTRGCATVYNVRLETSRLASALGDGNGTAGIEILAYGTAIKRVDALRPGQAQVR